MGDLLGNILLSILAILLPPIAAIIKVYSFLNEIIYKEKFFSVYLGRLYIPFFS